MILESVFDQKNKLIGEISLHLDGWHATIIKPDGNRVAILNTFSSREEARKAITDFSRPIDLDLACKHKNILRSGPQCFCLLCDATFCLRCKTELLPKNKEWLCPKCLAIKDSLPKNTNIKEAIRRFW